MRELPCGPPEPLRIPPNPARGVRSPLLAQCQTVPVSVVQKSHQEAGQSTIRASRSCSAGRNRADPPKKSSKSTEPRQTPKYSGPFISPLDASTMYKGRLSQNPPCRVTRAPHVHPVAANRQCPSRHGQEILQVHRTPTPHQPFWPQPLTRHPIHHTSGSDGPSAPRGVLLGQETHHPYTGRQAVVRDQALKISPSPRNPDKPWKFPTPTSHQTPHPSPDKVRPPIIPPGVPPWQHTADP